MFPKWKSKTGNERQGQDRKLGKAEREKIRARVGRTNIIGCWPHAPGVIQAGLERQGPQR